MVLVYMLTWLGYIDGIHGAPYIAAPWILREIPSGDEQFAMENHHAIKSGKPSISMGHLYHDYVSHNQRVLLNK